MSQKVSAQTTNFEIINIIENVIENVLNPETVTGGLDRSTDRQTAFDLQRSVSNEYIIDSETEPTAMGRYSGMERS